MTEPLSEKTERLLKSLMELEKVLVAFSGGADSAFLAAAAFKALGDKAWALTVRSPGTAKREIKDAREISDMIGINYAEMCLSELKDRDFAKNPEDRCYYCKRYRFEKILSLASNRGFKWVLEGSNKDDLSDYRPGMRALKDLDGVKSPLLDLGFTKEEIRTASRAWGLKTWDKPSSACLVSRVACSIPLSDEILRQVEKGEEFIRSLCPEKSQLRLRHHGDLARIEAEPKALQNLAAKGTRDSIVRYLKSLGYKWVSLDLAGYGMGSMNESTGGGHEL